MALSRRGFHLALGAAALARGQPLRPNILWITCEDMGPHLGCYGDSYARTPNLDRLAARGVIYRNAWSTAPVCAPARTAIISGLYPSSTGSEHMRSLVRLPSYMRLYPQLLREAGYYTTNNVKEDYNVEKPGRVWDESSTKAHWRNRRPGQPFFAVFNLTITHESQIRRRPHQLGHDPTKVRLPAYHPDTPEVRHDWAQYYDNITAMDGQAGELLRQLETDGLAESTIVFFYSDHGAGMPRHKRWPYDSGLRIPLIVAIPEAFRQLAPRDYRFGGRIDRLVSFVDFAPTVLSLAGIRPPSWMQGTAFLGPYAGPEPPYLHGLRGRMDERFDLVRSVRDRRYIYIRNYMPHLIYGQHLAYMFETPTTRIWKRLYDEGRLRPPQTFFWERKPPEELYDLEVDPDEVRNLARSPEYRQVLERLRAAQREHALAIRDLGFLPEDELHARSAGSTPYEVGQDERRYPLRRILETAEAASSLQAGAVARLAAALDDPDSAVRYWGALGLLMRGPAAVEPHRAQMRRALRDSAPSVRIVAAQALGEIGVLLELASLERHNLFVVLQALNALDAMETSALRPYRAALEGLPLEHPSIPNRMRSYVARLVEHLRSKWA
ncbi:MAG: sulfatase-like hydrolase/transferase [Bryobacterales bacterium]|nr:sulfatase-like hydrolase/transferase [Bryobacterales bacterium]